MFTGIIEEIGVLQSVKKGEHSSVLTIQAKKVLEDTKVGDSIAANGVCLTVTAIGTNSYQMDVMAETLRRSNLGSLKTGDCLNLERALPVNGRLGGHIVSGHIDGVGDIVHIHKEDNATWITISADKNLLRYIVEKGSIAIDGISLTIAEVTKQNFSVSIIPHTITETILQKKKIGDTVNLECDILGKYVEKLLNLENSEQQTKESHIDLEFLKSHGF